MQTAAEYARAYLFEHNLRLAPISPGDKAPQGKEVNRWQKSDSPFANPNDLLAYLAQRPQHGLGCVHEFSGTCTLDIDNDLAGDALAAVGIDLAAIEAVPTWQSVGSKPKSWFRRPAGLGNRKLTFPNPDPDPQARPIAIVELRCNGQDVLPPTIHPDHGRPFAWTVGRSPWDLPLAELPDELLDLWQRWDGLVATMQDACPWAPPDVAAAFAEAMGDDLPRGIPRSTTTLDWEGIRADVRGRLNVRDLLSQVGATPAGRDKYLCPFHREKSPSFWVFRGDDGNERWCCSHGSAPVGTSTSSGYSVGDAIDLLQLARGLASPGKALAEAAKDFGLIPDGDAVSPDKHIRAVVKDLADVQNQEAVARQWLNVELWNKDQISPLGTDDLRERFNAAVKLERDKRQVDDYAELTAKFGSAEVNEAKARADAGLPPEESKDAKPERAKWRAVILQSKPKQVKLFSPLWDGYITLSGPQFLDAQAVRREAFNQKEVGLGRGFPKFWDGSGKQIGLCQELINSKEHEAAPADVHRDAIVAERILEKLSRANLTENAELLKSGRAYRYVRDGVELIVFNFTKMHNDLSRCEDKINRTELSEILQICGFSDFRISRSCRKRLVSITPSGVERLEKLASLQDVQDSEPDGSYGAHEVGGRSGGFAGAPFGSQDESGNGDATSAPAIPGSEGDF